MIKSMMFATAAIAAVATAPAMAQTNTTFTTTSGASAAPTGATTVLNFNSSSAVTEASGKGITLTSGGFSQQYSGSSFGNGTGFDYAAPSPQDGGFYGIGGTTAGNTVPQSFAQFSAANGQTFSNISVFIGSLDAYNAVQLFYANGSSDTFTGTQLNGGTTPGFPGGAINTRATFTAQNGLSYTGVRFFNNTNQGSLEFDNVAFTQTAAVPEPASWAMMIMGMGMVGGTARRRRSAGKLALA